MINSKTSMKLALLGFCALSASVANADPVVYTMRTVADGKLGNRSFTQALVTIRLTGNTGNVRQQSGSHGGVISTNSQGVATVTVDDGYRTTVARFAPGEVYVRYDTYSGIVSFGSPISPTYPIALGCADEVDSTYVQDCALGDWTTTALGNSPQQGMYNGTSEALADFASISSDSIYVSDAVYYLPATLTQTTLLTGRAHTCAGAYSIVPPYTQTQTTFNLDKCPAAAPRGLVTSNGPFFLQDQFGINFGTENNTGALQVEVMPRNSGSDD
jgi:hypothetical protein